jgi:tetratricopeptide (TPR) repeat protein
LTPFTKCGHRTRLRFEMSALADRQNPWLGLAAYGERECEFFFGRATETAELLRLVEDEPLVVLYGVSGLGKTSLVQAGLFPGLRAHEFLPVLLRLHHDDEPTVTQHIEETMVYVERTARDADVKSPERADTSATLWEYFHRRDAQFWNSRNRLLTPVLVFDQFEEFFTLGGETERRREQAAEFFQQLSDLIYNRPPASFREKLESGRIQASDFIFDPVPLRVGIALREDFLPQLSELRQGGFPTLLKSCLRLRPLSLEAARECIERPSPELLALSVAERLVRFLAGVETATSAPSPGPEVKSLSGSESVEPALLSVVCRELNAERIRRGLPQINADLLNLSQEQILAEFYERSWEGLATELRHFIEDELLTTGGFRDSRALDDALSYPGITQHDIAQLIDRRILHYQDRQDGPRRIELTHDLLCRVVRASRQLRKERDTARAAEEQRRREAEVAIEREAEIRGKLRRSRRLAAVFAGLLVMAVGFLIYGLHMRQAAQRKTEELSENHIKKLRSELQDPTAGDDKDAQDIIHTLEEYASQFRSSDVIQQRYAQSLALAAEILYQNGRLKEGLERAGEALKRVSKLEGPGISDDLLHLSNAEAHYAMGAGLFRTGHLREAREHFQTAAQLSAASTQASLTEDAARTYIQAELGLGDLEIDCYDLETATKHYEQVLTFVDTSHPKNAADASFGKVMALRGLGLVQTDDAEAQRQFDKAGKLLDQLIKNYPDKLRWQRLSSELTYLEGVSAQSLGQFTNAAQKLEYSVNTSTTLTNRNPNNLDWQFGLARSFLGSGILQKSLGLWKRSQEDFEQVTNLTWKIQQEQPDWLRSRYFHAVARYFLADLAQSRGYLTNTLSEFQKTRASLEDIAKQAPDYREVVRSIAVVTYNQALIHMKQEDYQESRDLCAQGLEELRPLEKGGTRNRLVLETCEYLHQLIGDAWLQEKKYPEAVSAYKEAADIRAEMVRTTSEPLRDDLMRLSDIHVLLGDALMQANEPAKASSDYDLAAETIQRALKAHPLDGGLLWQKSRIQWRVADMWFKQNDLARSFVALRGAVDTAKQGFSDDPLDLDLMRLLEFFHGWTTNNLYSVVRKGQPAANSQSEQATTDQSAELLPKIEKLVKEINPKELLFPNPHEFRNNRILVPKEPQNWALSPLMAGAWRTLVPREQRVEIERLVAALPDKRLTPERFLRVRMQRLNFYDDTTLFEAEIEQKNNGNGIVSYVRHGGKTVVLDGTSWWSRVETNDWPPKIDRVYQATAYLRFFVGSLQSENGRFMLIDRAEDIQWRPDATDEERADITRLIKPLIVQETRDGKWNASGTIQYADTIFYCLFRVFRDGRVEMSTDNPAAVKLPIIAERFTNGVRELVEPD